MKIYIAGPMRGIKEFNKMGFFNKEVELAWNGFDPVNPWKGDIEAGIDLSSETGDTSDIEGFNQASMKEIIMRDVASLLECDGICMLEGWEKSKGATAERAIAIWFDLELIS